MAKNKDLCKNHIENIHNGTPCDSCPVNEIKIMARNDSDNSAINDVIVSELHTIRRELEQLNHTINGNGQPGLKTRIAVLENHSKTKNQGLSTNLVIISIILSSLIGVSGVVATLAQLVVR